LATHFSFLTGRLNYFKILFLPLGLHMERAVAEFGSIYSWQIFAALFIILAWATAAIKFWRKEKGIAFGFFWFFYFARADLWHRRESSLSDL